jgi:uncharacterized protein YfdQ (DUF2303 family)
MMDSSALSYLHALTGADAHSEGVLKVTAGTVVPLPENVRLNDLEQYLPGRRRYRGAMKTHLIAQFAEYTNECADAVVKDGSQVPCFINAEAMSAEAFFNLGDTTQPGHGDHRANIALSKTQAYTELLKIDGRAFGQRDFAEWLEDWADHIKTTTTAGVDIPLSQAVSAIRRITIAAKAEATNDETTFASRKSSMSEVEAKNKDTLPAFICFTAVPYHGLPLSEFRLRVGLITSGDAPKLSTRIVRLEDAQERIAEDFRGLLEKVLDEEKVRTFVGSFKP